jgi:K+-sensing histidine kinase KdpD
MLLHLIAAADDRTRREIDVEQLSSQLDRVLAPYLRRAGAAAPIDHAASPGALEPPRAAPIVLAEGDLVERAVQAGVRLGESASAEQVRADRLERETEALRALSETLQRTGSSFDAGQIIDEALASTRAMLRASAVTLLRASTSGQIAVERSWGHPDDPLCRCAQGREFLAREGGHSEPRVIADLSQELSSREAQIALSGLGAAAIVPVGRGEGRMLVVYLPVLAHGFRRQDVRLLAIIAGHLAVGLEKARLHQELAAQRDRLEATVAFKTRELCEAQEAARAEDPVRERLLSGLSQGIRTPLTALVSVGRTLRDRACSAGERRQLAVALVESAESLERQLDQLFRLIDLEDGSRQLVYVRSQPGELLNEALALAGCQAVSRVPASPPPPLCGDRAMLIRALANVIDDAARSSNSGSTLEITAQQGRAATASGGSVATVEFSVCDPRAESGSAGPEARFSPFERGCDGLGLYEARVIAHRHGGMLEFRPRAGGVREFRLSIPLEPLGAEPTGGRLDPCIR